MMYSPMCKIKQEKLKLSEAIMGHGRKAVLFFTFAAIFPLFEGAAVSSAVDDPLASYPPETCLCELDSTLRYAIGQELALQSGTAGVNGSTPLASYSTPSKGRTLTPTGYWVPSREYYGLQISSLVPRLCTCLAEGIMATRLFTWNRPWVDAMVDPYSTDFREMASEIESQFASVFSRGIYGDEYIAAYLTKLEQSITKNTIATVDLQWSVELDPELVRQHFYKLTSMGNKLGGISMDSPYFAPVQETSGKYGPEALEALLAEAKEYAISLRTPRLKPDDGFKFFYYVTCPAAAALGVIVFVCLFGLSEKGCLCRNITNKE